MEHGYTIIFLVGVLYAVITFLLGGIIDIAHIGGHFDVHIGHATPHLDGQVDHHGFLATAVSPFKPITIVSFITVFGGLGMMGTHYKYNEVLTFIFAVMAAFIVSYGLYKIIVIPLYKAQNTSAVYQEQLKGRKATVISPILEDGFGVISYVVGGSTANAPAQHVNKKAIKQGEEVLIYEIKNNVFYVQPLVEKEL